MSKKDNSTASKKASLRIETLRRLQEAGIERPMVLETHGGRGRLWQMCYAHLPTGIVLEKDERKAEFLAGQRPGWRVYQCEAERALAGSLASGEGIDVVDVDPYGDPWPTLEAWFGSERERQATLAVTVNDGLRNKLRRQGGWHIESLARAVEEFGNASLFTRYLDVARWNLARLAAGYEISEWAGYYCGSRGDMTHYAALLTR